ncbi:MAG: hypothetical protein IKO56_10150, partial [Alphaproteobacteria bacterium]|nr:hypothetical protein [Alphaproteobacteria bacterium]
IISNYASTCMADVEECYNQQNTQITSWTTSASVDNIYRVMTGACYNVALTCGYAVFAYDKKMGDDLQTIATEYLGDAYDLNSLTNAQKKELERRQAPTLIRGISEMFYQSFLCPEHSSYDDTYESTNAVVDNRVKGGWVNTRCKCDTGYTVWNGACLLSCADDQYRDTTTGVCTSCNTGYTATGGSTTVPEKENNRCDATTAATDDDVVADDEVQQAPSEYEALDAIP